MVLATRRGRLLQRLYGGASEAFNIVEPAQLFVESGKRDVSSSPGRFEHHAIREAQFGAAAESSEGSRDHLWILQDEVSVVEQHVDGGRELLVGEVED